MPHQRSKKARKLAAFALGATSAVTAACGHKTEIATRTVTLHAPLQCAPSLEGAAPFGLFLASGDFDPTVGVQQRMRDVGATLTGIPAATRSLVVDVGAGDLDWRGVRDVMPSGDVDVLLWPYLSPCALSTSVDRGSGVLLGAVSATRAIVVGGVAPPPPASLPRAWVADLTTGALAPMRDGLLTARARASVTSFGGGALVAGGVSAVDGTPLATAEVFVSTLHEVGDFDHVPIALSGQRHDHGALTLATGETLLVGGVGSNDLALRSLEIVDPVARSSRSQGLAQLEVARANPIVVRLANGEILVAGGTDDQLMPVTKLEWLTADGRAAARRSRDFVGRKRRGFVALPGGGALAVIAPDPNDSAAFQSVWVISADGEPEAASAIGSPLTGKPGSDIALFPGTEGEPLLWTGERWLRWSPWTGVFTQLDIAPPSVTDLPLGPDGIAIASPEPGLALFLTLDDTRITGLRFGARSTFATIVLPLFAGDAATDRLFASPDRLVLPGTTTSIAIDPQNGVTLIAGATVFLTDVTFAGVAIDLDAPTGEPPLIVLRDENGTETEIGAAACALPATPGAAQSIHLERSGASVHVGARDCGVTLRADARIAIGLRGAADSERSAARNVRVGRR